MIVIDTEGDHFLNPQGRGDQVIPEAEYRQSSG